MAVNKHEGMLNKLEGFHAEARITCGSGMKLNGIINGATAERGNKKKINVFTTHKVTEINLSRLTLLSLAQVFFLANGN